MPDTDTYGGAVSATGDAEELIPVGKAAKILGVSVSTMQRYDREGVFIAQRTPFTNQRRYRLGDVLALLNREHEGDSAA